MDFSARFPIYILLLIAIVIVAGAFSIFIFASTPLKNHLPGYLKESERTATEEQHLRVDSLVHVYEVNEAYIKSILAALNPDEETERNKIKDRKPLPLVPDSLKPASPEEKAFMEMIQERDKYNIAYVSPVAAQTLMFGSVNKSAIISQNSMESLQADIILPIGAPVSSVAEGRVISVASSPKVSGGYEVLIQHPKGFLSKSSRLSNVVVRPGDRVAAGQIIASSTAKPGMKSNHIVFELWRDGDPLIPARYLK